MSFEIGKNLESGESFSIRVKDAVASRTYIASETRFGKSHTARKIIEESFGHVGIIIIDPEGEYTSLRERYPFIIIGRDVQIEVETATLQTQTAEFMAQQVLETSSSVIIDLSVTADVESGKDYVDAFLRRFFHLQTVMKKPYLVLIEEAEDFCPESGSPGTRTVLEIGLTLARRGGKRGIGVIFVGHRPAWISKGILSQCPNKAVGRIEQPDMKALEDVARVPHSIVEKLVPKTDEKGEIIYSGPDVGVFYFTGDWVKKAGFVRVGPVQTAELGTSPEIIPRPAEDIQTVIETMQKKLGEVVQKIKPTVVSQAELESKIKTELENRYKGKIETIQRTADAKAERKYRIKIGELEGHLEKLSRSQALQPTAPITDVMEHPIVHSRMLQLDEKSRDLLTWVEREPGRTREELAARMVSSKDAIAGMVEKINRVFQLEVIVDDGKKPIHYKSMLKRLYLTDVGRKEIEELSRLQDRNKILEEENKTLRPSAQQSATLRSEAQRLTEDLGKKTSECSSLKALTEELGKKADALAKENEAYHKIKEGFAELGISPNPPSMDETKVKVLIEEKVKEAVSSIPTGSHAVPMEQIEALVEKKIAEKTAMPTGAILTSVELEHKVTHFDFQKSEEHFKVDKTMLQGRIIHLIIKGFFDERHNRKQVVEELSNNGWVHGDKEVDAALLELCGKGIFFRKISTGNTLWYWLQPEAKQLIHV